MITMAPAAHDGGLAADEALAGRDRALQGLGTVLNGDRLAELLAAAMPAAAVRSVQPTYVRYKPGTSCLVGCRLESAFGEMSGYVLLYRPNERGKLAKHAAARSGAGAQAILLPRYAAAFYPFPLDRRVIAAPALADPGRRGAVLRRALPGHPELWDADLTVLRRKPERRLVAKLSTPSGAAAVLKAHAAQFACANRAAKLTGGENPRTPHRLGRSRKWNVVVSEWLPGELLADSLASSAAPAAAAGVALAGLHRRHATDDLSCARVAGEQRRLAISARTVACLLPRERRAAERLALRLARSLGPDVVPVTTHGDFSADQVVIDHGVAALLDFDEAVLADPARDLGSFRASLIGDAVAGRLDERAAAGAARALAAGYEAAGGDVPDGRADLWTAAAILHLVPEPFRRREADWPAQAASLLRRAEAVVAP